MRMLKIVVIVGLLGGATMWAQTQPVTQNVTATAQCVSIRAQNNSTVGIIVSGTWSGTFTPNVQISTVSGAPTIAKKVVPVDSTTAQATVTANGGYRADVSGFSLFNFCSTAWTSGTAVVTLNVTTPPAASTVAGSSGGTVTGVSGTAPVASSGGATPAISLQNSAAANVTAALGTDTKYFTASGSAATNGDIITGDAQGGTQDSGTLLSSLAPKASPTFTGTVTLPGYVAPFFTSTHGSITAGIFSSSANKAAFVQVTLPFAITSTQVSYYVGTADTVNSSSNYDIGIYSGTSGGTCTLQAHTGPIVASTSMTANAHTVAWTGGTVTLQPGRYYIAYTSAATSATAILVGDNAFATFAGGGSAGSVGNVSVTAGGTLDASRTCPTDSYSLATATILAIN